MKKLMAGLLVAAVLVPAGQAGAATFGICAPGAGSSFMACASANVSFIPTMSGGTIVLQVKNLGLLDGTFSNSVGYAITGIGITAPDIPNAAWGGIDISHATPSGTDPAGEWKFTQSFAGFAVQAGADTKNGVNGGIWGCVAPGAGNTYLQTCGDQYVEFRFNTTDTNWYDPSSMTVNFAMRGQSGEQEGISYRCSEDAQGGSGQGGCAWDFQEDSTVPEPVSMVLLGSGLLGLAGIRSRRRHGR